MNKISIKIKTDYIKLSSAIKFSSLGISGGEAKILIENKQVRVNGIIETKKGKKIVKRDLIEVLPFNTIIEVI